MQRQRGRHVPRLPDRRSLPEHPGHTSDIDPRYAGAEGWPIGGEAAWKSPVGELRSAKGELIATTSTNGTPAIQADLLGDWREELAWPTSVSGR